MWASRRIEMPGEGCTSLPMGAGGYAQIYDCYVMYLLCYSFAGHSLGALMYLKT